MAIKKKQEGPAAKPAVSRLPMPPSDSALVIDLPDGQKLVIGKMEHGTVIEVATWRGTGRPDSRTSRMMLGMTNAELEASIEAAAAEAPAKDQELKSKIGSIKQDPKQFFMNVFKMILAGIKWLFNFRDQFGSDEKESRKQIRVEKHVNTDANKGETTIAGPSKISELSRKFDLKSKFKKRTDSTPKPPVLDDQNSVLRKDVDVEDWLDQIMAKAKAKATVTAVSNVESAPSSKKVAKKSIPAKKKSAPRR